MSFTARHAFLHAEGLRYVDFGGTGLPFLSETELPPRVRGQSILVNGRLRFQ